MSACKITASVYPESIVWGTNYVKKNKEFQRVKLFQISPKRIANLDNRFDLQSLVHRPVLYDALRRMIIRPIVTNQTFCVFLFFFLKGGIACLCCIFTEDFVRQNIRVPHQCSWNWVARSWTYHCFSHGLTAHLVNSTQLYFLIYFWNRWGIFQ